MRAGWRLPSSHLPTSDPFSGYFFTWTWRHRVSELEREGVLPWEGGEGPRGQDWRGPCPPSLPPHIGAIFPFLPTGTAGLTPSPPSGSLTSSTSVPMRECHPSKGGAVDGNQPGGGPVVSGLFFPASCSLQPGPRAIRGAIFSLHSRGARSPSPQP